MFYNENLYDLLCSCIILIFGKILIPEIWAKMFSANHIAGFFINHISRTNNEIAWFFACWYKFIYIKNWSKILWLGMLRNGCGQSGHRTIKLTVSQELFDRMNWFFACWCKLRKAKSYLTDFWVGLVKNGCDQLVCETVKSAEWVYGLS